MTIRKKLLALLAALALLLSLSACDLVGQETGRPPQADQTHSAEAEKPAPADESQTSAAPETDEKEEPEEAPAPADEEPAPTDNEGEPDPAQEPSEPESSDDPTGEETGGEEESPAESETTGTGAPALSGETVTAPPSSGVSAFELSGPALLGETADQGQEYVDQMIFLGDSTTYGMKYYAVLDGGKNTQQVWTPSNGTLTLSYQGFASIVYPPDGTEIPIRDAVSRAKPAYLVITLGVNGISFMDEEYFKSEYLSLVTDIQSLSPDTKILLQSIFPVASTYEYLSSINNDKISEANRWVMEVAEECNVRFLNTASVLVGADGWLPQELQNGDGLHLNEEGFKIVLSYIRTHGYQ